MSFNVYHEAYNCNELRCKNTSEIPHWEGTLLLSRFIRLFEVSSLLNHPNVVKSAGNLTLYSKATATFLVAGI